MKLSLPDEAILATIYLEVPEVRAILDWTGNHIQSSKRQVMKYQAAVLAYWAVKRNLPGANFLEIGTALGYSACVLATAAPQARLTTLNPKPGEYERGRDNLRIRANVRVVQRTSVQYLAEHPEREVNDLVFVDGDHSYPMVVHDSQYFDTLRPGGVILYHDYSPEGSARPSHGTFLALNELQACNRPADICVIGTGGIGMLGWIKRAGEVWVC